MAVNPDGTLVLPVKLRYGLAGSELVRLAAARRVDIVRGRIVIRDSGRTSDPLLDDALASMTSGWREPTAKAWVKSFLFRSQELRPPAPRHRVPLPRFALLHSAAS